MSHCARVRVVRPQTNLRNYSLSSKNQDNVYVCNIKTVILFLCSGLLPNEKLEHNLMTPERRLNYETVNSFQCLHITHHFKSFHSLPVTWLSNLGDLNYTHHILLYFYLNSLFYSFQSLHFNWKYLSVNLRSYCIQT